MMGEVVQLDLEDWANRATAEALSLKPKRPRRLGATFNEARDDARTETHYTRLCLFLSANPNVMFNIRELADGSKGGEQVTGARFREMRASGLPVDSKYCEERGCWVYWYQPKAGPA